MRETWDGEGGRRRRLESCQHKEGEGGLTEYDCGHKRDRCPSAFRRPRWWLAGVDRWYLVDSPENGEHDVAAKEREMLNVVRMVGDHTEIARHTPGSCASLHHPILPKTDHPLQVFLPRSAPIDRPSSVTLLSHSHDPVCHTHPSSCRRRALVRPLGPLIIAFIGALSWQF